MLNNKAPRPLTVHPTLFAPDGQRRAAPPVVVPAQAFRVVPLAELGALVGSPFQEGSLELVFQGQSLVLGAQLEMLDAARSVLLTERLSDARAALDTPRLEGVYRLPPGRRGATSFQVAVANLTDRAVNVTVALDGRDRAALPGAQLALGPRESRRLDMRAVAGEKLKPEGGVVITSDARGAVRANGLIWNADGYANTVLFTNPFAPRSTRLHANGVRFQPASGQPLTPYFTLHNFGDAPSRVAGKLFLTLTGGERTEALPTVTLSPGETLILPVVLPPGVRRQVVSAGAEFEYSTMPGTVAIAGASESADGNHAFRVPLLDAETIPSATGSYPWRVTATENTTVYLKNATDRAVSYHASLNFAGGWYSLGRRTLGAHQTAAIDLRALRDAQAPDATGNVIPAEATSGQFLWSVHGVELKSIVGRAEYADEELGVSSHYACYNCCGDSFGAGWITGFGILGAGLTGWYVAYERYVTCYGVWQRPQLAWVDGWWSSASDVGEVTITTQSGAEARGLFVGATNIIAEWSVFGCDSGAALFQASRPVFVQPTVRMQSFRFDPLTIFAATAGGGNSSTLKVFLTVQGLKPNHQLTVPLNADIFEQSGPANIQIVEPNKAAVFLGGENNIASTEVSFVFTALSDDRQTGQVVLGAEVRIADPQNDEYIIRQPNPKFSRRPRSQAEEEWLTVNK